MSTVESWCRDSPAVAAKALKLGPKSIDELANNVFRDADLMPAIERYTGVLYSATGVADWTPDQRDWAATHVFIHSALFGIISSTDPISAYRLSYDTKVAGRALKEYWGEQVGDAVREMAAGDWVLDARSGGYRDLAPIPAGVPNYYLDVVAANGGKALNHFNKIHKGELVAALVADSPDLAAPEDLVNWANSVGIDVRHTLDFITLVV
ncbi:MAG: peroxide stress protein YaaA [Actinomycetota bacterium]